MFSEAVDFAPVQPRSSRRKQVAFLPTQAALVNEKKLTPKETQNHLCQQVGIDSALLDGISYDLLDGLKPGHLRVAMYEAVAALQKGKVVTVLEWSSLEEFLIYKIGLLPLAIRFPLMGQWAAPRAPPAFKDPRMPAVSVQAAPIETGFISFDSVPGAEGSTAAKADRPREQRQIAASSAAEEAPPKPPKKAKDKAREKKLRAAFQAEAYDPEEEVIRPKPVEPSPPIPVAKEANTFLEELPKNTEQFEKEAARREEEAKKAAEKVMFTLAKTKASVDAGILAAKRSGKLQTGFEASQNEGFSKVASDGKSASGMESFDTGESRHRDDVENTERGLGLEPRRRYSRSRSYRAKQDSFDADERNMAPRRNTRGYDSRSCDRRNRYASEGKDAGAERQQDYGRDQGRRYHNDQNYERGYGGRRGQGRFDSRERGAGENWRYSDSRSRGRNGGNAGARKNQYGQRRADSREPSYRTQDDLDAAAVRGRKRSVDSRRPARSSSADRGRAHGRRQSPGREVKRSSIFESAPPAPLAIAANSKPQASVSVSGFATPAPSGAAPGTATPAPGAAAARPPPKLRQLAFKDGWAEYIDENTGEHVYKNVFTGEMTKKKPVEMGHNISAQQDQRRLNWLANTRMAAQANDPSTLMQGQQALARPAIASAPAGML